MALVEDLYKKLSEGGYYTKTLGEFEAQLEDPMYRKKVHNVVTRDGIEDTDFETFDVKYTPLKKKEESGLPSMESETSGSLATPEMGTQEPLVSSSSENKPEIFNPTPDAPEVDVMEEIPVSRTVEITTTEKTGGLFKKKKKKDEKEQKSFLTKEEKKGGEALLKDSHDTYIKWQEQRNQELLAQETGDLSVKTDYSVLNEGTPRKELQTVTITAPEEKKRKFKDKFEEFYYTYMYPMGKSKGMREYFRLLKENRNNPDYKNFLEYAVNEDSIFKDARNNINYEIFRSGEATAANLLNGTLARYGYDVQQSTIGEDWVTITSPGKQKIQLKTNVIGGESQAKKLLEFVYDTWRDEKEIRYIGQKDYEDGDKGLNNYVDDVVDFALTDINKFKNLIDQDVFQSSLERRSRDTSYDVMNLEDQVSNFNKLYEDYNSKLSFRNNLVTTYNDLLNKYKKSGKKDLEAEAALKAYYQSIQDFEKTYDFEAELKKLQDDQLYIQDRKSIVEKQVKDLDNISSALTQSLPLQQAEREKQGSFLGFVAAKFTGGVLDVTQAATYLAADVMAPVIGYIFGAENLMPESEYEKLKEQGLSDFDIIDKTSKELKRMVTKDLNKIGEFYFDTTEEYMQSEDRSTFEVVLGSVLESVGAATAAPKGLGFYAQSYGNVEEMMLDPSFDGLSEMEKKLISIPYALAMGGLEKFGFNVLSGSNKSLTNKLIIDTIGRSMAKLPKNASIDAIKHEINKDLSSMLVTGGLDYFLSAGAEGVVEGTQSLTETGVKSIVNAIYEKELFKNVPDITTYDGVIKALSQAGEETYMGTLGGLMFATVTNSYNIIKGGKFNKQSNELFDQYEKLLKDGTTLKSVENLIKIEVDKGSITEEQALEVLNSVKECQQIISTVPDNLSTEDKRRSFDLLLEKKGLEQDIAGKDEALITGQKERIEQINNDLKIISRNAIEESTKQQQEGTAEGGVVQREGVDQGQPQVGQGEGAVGETTQPEANISDSTVTGGGIQETEVVTEQPVVEEINIVPGETAVVSDVQITYPTNEEAEVRREERTRPEYVEATSENLQEENVEQLSQELEGEFGLLTAENPMAQPLTEEENTQLNQKAEEWLKSRGYNPRRVTGKYDQAENSFFVPNLTFNDAVDFANQFNQEAVAHSEGLVYQDGTINPRVKQDDDFSFQSYSPESNFVSVVKTPSGLKTFSVGYNTKIRTNFTPASQSSMGTVISGTDVDIDNQAAQISKPRMTKIVANAAKAVSRILPNNKFIVHDTQDSFTAATGETDAGGYFDPASGEIHINLEQANARTVAHEVFHAVLLNAVKTDANAAVTTRKMIEAVSKKIDSNPQLKQYLDDFASNYEDNIQNEEKVSELVGVLAEQYESSTESVKDVIKRWLDRIAKAFGLNPFNRNEVYDVLNTVARKTAKGKTIKQKDIVLITKETPGSDSFIGSFNIPRKSKGKKAPSVKNDPRDFIRNFVQDLDIREFNGQNFVTNMYDYTNAGITDLGNGFSINTLGGKNYVPLMMSLKNLNIGDVSNLAAFNTKAQAETFIRNAEMGNANLFAPHAGTLDQSWQFQQHTFAELFNLVLDNGILKPKELISTFNNVIKNNKENQAQFKQFAERYGKNIKNFNSFISDPKKIIDLLDINNNYSPKLRKALNSAIASNKKFKQAIGANNLNEFYKRIMDPLNDGVIGGEIMNVVDFDPNTFEIVQTNPNDIDHHPSFGWTLLAKINGIYQPTEFHKSSDITDTYTKYNISGAETSVKIEEPKFEQKNVSSSAGAIPKVAKFNVSPRRQKVLKDKGLSDKSINTIESNYQDKFGFNDFDWNKESDRDNFKEWLYNFEDKQFNKNLDKVTKLVKEDIDLLTERKIIEKKLKSFEELIIPSLGDDVLTKPLSLFEQMIIMDPNATIDSIEKGFKEAKNIFNEEGDIDNRKITKSQIFKGGEINLSAFERFIQKNPEYKGVFNDWKKIFDKDIELTLKDTNAFRSVSLESLNNLYDELTKLKSEQPAPRRQKSLPKEVADKLTEDGKGNYIFHHYSGKRRETIQPRSGDNIITSREEAAALSSVGGVAQFYTQEGQKEAGVGPVLHTIVVPKDKVYYLQNDVENFYDEAKRQFLEVRPGQAFNANYQAAWIGKVASDNGYDMLVSNWRGDQLRAQTVKELTPIEENIPFKEREANVYKVGDEVIVYGSKATITAMDGTVATFKGEGVAGSIDTDRNANLITKVRRQKSLKDDKTLKIIDKNKKYIEDRTKKTTAKGTWRKYLQKFENRQSDIKRSISGIDSVYSRRASDLLVDKAGASGWADERFKEADKKIYKGLSIKDLDILNAMIYAKRIIAINKNRAERGMKPYTGMDGYSTSDAEQSLKNYKESYGDKKYADFENRTKEYFKVYEENLKEAYESGRITEQVYNMLKDIDYSPIRTLKYIIGDEAKTAEEIDRLSSIIGMKSDQIEKLGDINENEFVSDTRYLLMASINASSKKGFENRLLNAVFDTFENANDSETFDIMEEFYEYNPVVGTRKDGSLIHKYDKEKIPHGYKEVVFYKDGVKRKMVMKSKYADQLLDLIKVGEGWKTAGKLSGGTLLRFFATSGNPLFILGNVPADFSNILFISDVYGKIKPIGAVRLAFDFVKNFLRSTTTIKLKEIKREYLKHGGSMSYMAADGVRNLQSKVAKYKVLTYPQKALVAYGKTMSYLGEKSEEAFRLAVYEKTKSDLIKKYKKENNGLDPQGQDLEDIMYASVREAREVIDFNQGGEWAKNADTVAPYFNAGMQGFRRIREYAAKKPFAFASSMVQAATMAGGIAAYSIAALMQSACAEAEDEDDCNKKMMDALNSLSEYEKSNYHIIFTGKKDENGEYEYIRIKKLPGLSVVTTYAEQLFTKFFFSSRGVDYDPNNKTMGNAIRSSLPFDPTGIVGRNPLVSGAVAYMGFDLFKWEETFKKPRGWEDRVIKSEVEGINDDNVNSLFKSIAPMLHMSPARTQAMVEKLITSESTNPTISILYAVANGLFGEGSDLKESFSLATDELIKNTSKKLVRTTNKKLLEYAEQDKIAEREIEENSDEYVNTTKMYDDIKDIYDSGKTLTNGQLIDMIMETFEPATKSELRSYFSKYNNYIRNRSLDKRLLNIVFENKPKLQALYLYERYGTSLEKEEIDELNTIMKQTGSKIPEVTLIYYNKNYYKK